MENKFFYQPSEACIFNYNTLLLLSTSELKDLRDFISSVRSRHDYHQLCDTGLKKRQFCFLLKVMTEILKNNVTVAKKTIVHKIPIKV